MAEATRRLLSYPQECELRCRHALRSGMVGDPLGDFQRFLAILGRQQAAIVAPGSTSFGGRLAQRVFAREHTAPVDYRELR